jgi:hypothetical protein
MFIEGMNSEYLNVSYTNTFYFFKKYIETQGGGKNSLKLDGINSNKTRIDNQVEKKYVLRYTKIKKSDLVKLLNGSTMKLNSVTAKDNETKTHNVKPTLVSWLANSVDKSLYSIKDKNTLLNTKRDPEVGGSTDVPTLLSKKYGDDQKFDPLSNLV